MIVAELLCLLAILGGVGVGGYAFSSWSKEAGKKRQAREKHLVQRYDDLREALKSGDYRKLDDFMAIWGHECEDKVLQHVKQRRDELYIEADNRK